ncbi:hypothetical protein [Methylobacterium frigidaeris]|uniref:Uncharacterized protein n=1 Tax=Methylobacterium frigidaeris TaxID=2038277 RepID=A0AA37HH55_9HYPH|nr:hypothetical protein [Methylobacterium frigidaeris]GJD65466.1 hypothetical protein MPEAHAMD_5659 [Methylobacterium frigidaeris]
MASSPSIASTRSIASAQASSKPGLFAKMMRLWAEHNRRVAEFGVLPF